MSTVASPISQTAVGTERVALYSRVSTDDQTDRGTVRGQRDFLANFAQLYGLEVASEYVDDGFSGTLRLGDRPDGRRLLEDAHQGRFGVVLVYRLDRLGRSLSALLEANAALEQIGVTIRSATEPFDTSTPIGRFLFQLLGSLAELEKSTISERMTLGRDRVARSGKWTNGPIPFGYDLDGNGCLIPSARLVEGLELNEAELARSVIQRIADGSSTVIEARRLNTLSVPTHRRYAGGAKVTVGGTWLPSRINQMVKNPVYAGTHILKSKTGPIERAVPPLVDRPLWDQAQAQLTRNRALATRNAKRSYLLRGLVRCNDCGVGYVGTPSYGASGWSSHYYRCGSQLGAVHPEVHERCRGKALPAQWLEDLVWHDCRDFILNPGDALSEAQAQLRDRLSQVASLEGKRRQLQHQIAAKDGERERVMTLYRRGRATLSDTESQLDAIQLEVRDLQTTLDAMRTQEELAHAFEAHYANAATLLVQLAGRLEEIEATNDWTTKRQVIELLVSAIQVTTHGTGRTKEADLVITYSFSGRQVVDTTMSSRGGSPDRD
jgi:site-specific DNA recombinase